MRQRLLKETAVVFCQLAANVSINQVILRQFDFFEERVIREIPLLETFFFLLRENSQQVTFDGFLLALL